MIVSSINNITAQDHSIEFGYAIKDGRLTGEPNGKKYRLREDIRAVEKIGRLLTYEEMAQFEINNNIVFKEERYNCLSL